MGEDLGEIEIIYIYKNVTKKTASYIINGELRHTLTIFLTSKYYRQWASLDFDYEDLSMFVYINHNTHIKYQC